MSDPEKPEQAKPGPDPERLKIDGDWEDAMKRALKVEKPADGWPKPDQDQKNQDG